MEETNTVLMVRDHETYPSPHTADVHPDEVENWMAGGWTLAPAEDISPKGEEVKAVTDMTVAELRAFAKDHAITLGADVTTKDAILAAIQNSDWQLNSADPKE